MPITGLPGGTVTKCIKLKTGEVRNPGAYCAAIADKLEPGWRDSKMKKRVSRKTPKRNAKKTTKRKTAKKTTKRKTAKKTTKRKTAKKTTKRKTKVSAAHKKARAGKRKTSKKAGKRRAKSTALPKSTQARIRKLEGELKKCSAVRSAAGKPHAKRAAASIRSEIKKLRSAAGCNLAKARAKSMGQKWGVKCPEKMGKKKAAFILPAKSGTLRDFMNEGR